MKKRFNLDSTAERLGIGTDSRQKARMPPPGRDPDSK